MRGVLILGMHRSGTSCLAGTLQSNGLVSGDIHEWNPFNQKGNRENQAFVDLNEQLLELNNASWDKPPEQAIHWTDSEINQQNTLIQNMEENATKQNAAFWGFKDPRTLLNIAFWTSKPDYFAAIASFRHPLSVAKSLNHRNRMPIEEGVWLWCQYNKRLLNYLEQNTDTSLVCFDKSQDEYQKKVQACMENLNIKINHNNAIQNGFFDPSLRHHKPDSDRVTGLDTEAETIYSGLMHFYENQ